MLTVHRFVCVCVCGVVCRASGAYAYFYLGLLTHSSQLTRLFEPFQPHRRIEGTAQLDSTRLNSTQVDSTHAARFGLGLGLVWFARPDLAGRILSTIFLRYWHYPPLTPGVALSHLRSMLGVHVRWWTSHMVLTGSSRWPTCGGSGSGGLRWHPMSFVWKCAIDDFDVVWAIEAAQR
jgi:hypothetical protein